MWLVIGMGLFRDRSIPAVAQHLDLLFRMTTERWDVRAADAQRWRGLAVYGVDGSTLRIADTPENDTAFGRPGSNRGGAASYPQLRLVTLMALRAHLLAGLALGPLPHR